MPAAATMEMVLSMCLSLLFRTYEALLPHNMRGNIPLQAKDLPAELITGAKAASGMKTHQNLAD
jgi:hypothetical protein